MPLPARITLDMSISKEEFRRTIRTLPEKGESLHELPLHENETTWLLHTPGGTARITFCSHSPRRFGMLALPRALVKLDLADIPTPARTRFISRFRRHYHRGGG